MSNVLLNFPEEYLDVVQVHRGHLQFCAEHDDPIDLLECCWRVFEFKGYCCNLTDHVVVFKDNILGVLTIDLDFSGSGTGY